MEINKLEFLKKINIFSTVSENLLSKIAEITEVCEVKAGTEIFREGDPAGEIFIIFSGQLTISKRVSADTEKVLSILGPQEVFGEMGLFSNLKRSADAKARTDSIYLKIECNKLRNLFELDPKGSQELLRLMLLSTMERLEQTSRELATVYEISKIISKDLSLKEFVSTVLEQIIYSVPDVSSGMIYLWNEFTEEYDLVAKKISKTEKGTWHKNIGETISKNNELITKLILKLNSDAETIIISENAVKRKLIDTEELPDRFIITPLISGETLYGLIILSSDKEIKNQTRIIDLMNSLGNQIMEAIKNIKEKEDKIARERFDRSRKGSITW